MSYSVALIGCGRISYKHLEGLVNNRKQVKLSALCDIIEERALEKRANFIEDMTPFQRIDSRELKVYTDYRKMLDEIAPDIVIVATESGYHSRITIDALQAGAHVIVEKPMALSTADAEAMIETSKSVNKKLGVCFQNRFNPPVERTYRALKEGRFGKLFHGAVQIRWNRNEEYYRQAPWRGTWELDGGTLMNQCTHGIDLLQWLMGENAQRVYGVTRRYFRPIEAEDFGSAIVEFDDNRVGIIEGSANVFPVNLNETLSLFGETGTVVIGGLAVNKLEYWRFADSAERGDVEEKVIDPNQKDPPNVYGYGHTALLADFVEAVKNDRKPFIDGESGKKTLDLILAIYKSMKEKRPVDLPIEFDTRWMKGIFD